MSRKKTSAGGGDEQRHHQARTGVWLPDSQLQFVQDPEKYRAGSQGAAPAGAASVSQAPASYGPVAGSSDVTGRDPSLDGSGREAPIGAADPVPAVRRDHLVRLVIWLTILGALLGLVWYLLCPHGEVAVWNGVEWLPKDDAGLWLRQDLTFAALMAAAGLVVGLVLVGRARRPRPARRLVAALLGTCLGTAAALGVGWVLQPAGSAAEAGNTGPAPLVLHALGFAGTWPLVAMATCAVLLIIRSFSSR